MKFGEGIGSYVVGEVPVRQQTEAYALRKAGHDLGIDPAAWQFGDKTETKKSITVNVIRKVQPPVQTETPALSSAEPDSAVIEQAPVMRAIEEGAMHQPVEPAAPADTTTEVAEGAKSTEDETVAFEATPPAKGKKGKGEKSEEPEVPAIVMVGRADLLEALKVCLAIAGSGSGMIPTLSHVLLSASKSELVLSATSLDIAYTARGGLRGLGPGGRSGSR